MAFSVVDFLPSFCTVTKNKQLLLSFLVTVIGTGCLLQLGYFVIVKEILLVDTRHSHYNSLSNDDDFFEDLQNGSSLAWLLPAGVVHLNDSNSLELRTANDGITQDIERNGTLNGTVLMPIYQWNRTKAAENNAKATHIREMGKIFLGKLLHSRSNQRKLKQYNRSKNTLMSRMKPSPRMKAESQQKLLPSFHRSTMKSTAVLSSPTQAASSILQLRNYSSHAVEIDNNQEENYTELPQEESLPWWLFKRLMKKVVYEPARPSKRSKVDQSALSVAKHRKEWNQRNNGSTCQEWRFERQNWTAIVTGRILRNVRDGCSSPYESSKVRRILFQNRTEEFTGCTKQTKRCKQGASFDYKNNVRINVPPCCRKHLLDTYRDIEFELTRLDVEHFMIGGSVIGWMRNKRMVPYDDDLDILVPMSFWKTGKFWEFVQKMRNTYEHPCRLVESTKMKIYYSERNNINVDMWPYEIVYPRIKRTRIARLHRLRRVRRLKRKTNRRVRTKRGIRGKRKQQQRRKTRRKQSVNYVERKRKLSKRKRAKSRKRKIKKKPKPHIDIPYKNFKLQPVSNLIPPKQVVFENFLVYFPNNPEAYLDKQYGKGKWRHELTCKEVDSDGTCTE